VVRTYQVGLLAGCLIHLVSGLNATTIVEIQQDLASESPILLGQPVTVEGIVTASAAADNLGTVFIQEAGAEAWAGIRLSSGTGIFDLMVGDRVRVSGTVAERSGMTEIESISEVEILGKGTILPTQVDPQLFTSWSPDVNEKYELSFRKETSLQRPKESWFTGFPT
jgi:predicted extracellular nuclease